MKFNLGCNLRYKIQTFSTLVFNIQVVNNNFQKVLQESLKIEPNLAIEESFSSSSENRYFRVNVNADTPLEISYQATVELSHFYGNPDEIPETQPANLPLEIWQYLYPSRYCQSDQLLHLAQSEFGHLYPGYSRVTAICNWIYEKVTYLSGSTNSHTSAYDTATQRQGVCRDFAHLGIAFCRALNIPARFVAGYAYQLTPPDFHAYFEAYLGDRWYLFDPTRLAPQTGLIRIGTGRDAADASFATIFGSVEMETMNVFVEQLPEEALNAENPDYTLAAIATS